MRSWSFLALVLCGCTVTINSGGPARIPKAALQELKFQEPGTDPEVVNLAYEVWKENPERTDALAKVKEGYEQLRPTISREWLSLPPSRNELLLTAAELGGEEDLELVFHRTPAAPTETREAVVQAVPIPAGLDILVKRLKDDEDLRAIVVNRLLSEPEGVDAAVQWIDYEDSEDRGLDALALVEPQHTWLVAESAALPDRVRRAAFERAITNTPDAVRTAALLDDELLGERAWSLLTAAREAPEAAGDTVIAKRGQTDPVGTTVFLWQTGHPKAKTWVIRALTDHTSEAVEAFRELPETRAAAADWMTAAEDRAARRAAALVLRDALPVDDPRLAELDELLVKLIRSVNKASERWASVQGSVNRANTANRWLQGWVGGRLGSIARRLATDAMLAIDFEAVRQMAVYRPAPYLAVMAEEPGAYLREIALRGRRPADAPAAGDPWTGVPPGRVVGDEVVPDGWRELQTEDVETYGVVMPHPTEASERVDCGDSYEGTVHWREATVKGITWYDIALSAEGLRARDDTLVLDCTAAVVGAMGPWKHNSSGATLRSNWSPIRTQGAMLEGGIQTRYGPSVRYIYEDESQRFVVAETSRREGGVQIRAVKFPPSSRPSTEHAEWFFGWE